MSHQTHNIVCISTIDWDFIWQGHQEIMSSLARSGNRVLFIENTGVRRPTLKDLPRLRKRIANWRIGIRGIRRVMDNLYVYSPLVLPFPYSRVARMINRMIMILTLRSWAKTMRFDSPIIWTWLPTGLALDLIKALNGKLTVYYCFDNFEAVGHGAKGIRKTERVLIKKADLVFVTAQNLFNYCAVYNPHVHLFPSGFSKSVFTQSGRVLPADIASIKRPLIGYVGGVHKVVDFELVEKIAVTHADKSLVFVGPLQADVGSLTRYSNVHFLGQRKYEQLPDYIASFDLCIIPYLLNEYSRNVYPTKLNEYLAMGKPVVSTRLPEVEHFNQGHQGIVAIADDHEAFIKQIEEELRRDTRALRTRRTILVSKNSWDDKIEAMKGLIRAKLEEQAKVQDLNWQHTLLGFYRSSRRRVAAMAVACLLTYGLVFYTPIIWLLAEPLRTIDPPEPADAIVVLAGGIGESGNAGEEYQEKVKRAVELYQQGYASNLIFSSGATYVFNEAQVMKALAVSLGIPERAIILDEQGGGNYSSFMSVRNIMEARNWSRMLLVSSRYNGARSRLVAAKNFPRGHVALTPASRSAFFGNQADVRWKHVRAIGHEYAGIIYYWWKGYL